MEIKIFELFYIPILFVSITVVVFVFSISHYGQRLSIFDFNNVFLSKPFK